MSNLGLYQEFSIAAARQGGVENMIRSIEFGAVAKAAPGLLVKGAGIGTLATLATGGLVFGGRGLWSIYKARAQAAVAAKEQLRAALNDQEDSDGPSERVDET